MHTVKVYRLDHLSHTMFGRLKAAQKEAAQVWNLCMETHKAARQTHVKWPGRNELQQATKGTFAWHSQSVQMIVHVFLANVNTTRQVKPTNPKMKYPWKTKRFYPVMWPAHFFLQAEDGIRVGRVTGVQTCALPISGVPARDRPRGARPRRRLGAAHRERQ